MSEKTTTRTGWGLNKFSFYTMATAAILYLVAAILSLINATKLATAVGVLQGLATAIMVGIVAVLAWKYARHKTTAWKGFVPVSNKRNRYKARTLDKYAISNALASFINYHNSKRNL